ncbi:hypothetical protein NDU88_003334 [Pleurodeles waltl]|uniref:Uncharacterized protein n=1 Tax=Pleurodeles waltl TaxID=8319 RepID=A0AAV7V0A7_PLEWA|nr:hypothetical protein NDU88_003334 [Pleurodeles waltl]
MLRAAGCRVLPCSRARVKRLESCKAGGRKDNFTADFLSRLPVFDESTVDVEDDVEDCFIAVVDADESKVCTETCCLARGNITACRTYVACCRLSRSPVLSSASETVGKLRGRRT